MPQPSPVTRRTFLAGAGTSLIAGTAGCFGELTSGGSSDDEDAAESEAVLPDEWPTAGGTRALTGNRPENDPPSTGTAAWERTLDARVRTDPVVGDGLLAIATDAGTVLGLAADSGDVRWRYESSTAEHGGIALTDDHAIHLDGDGTATAIDRETGDADWEVPGDGAGAGGAPTVSGSSVLLPRDEDLRAIDVADGSTQWQASVDHRPSTIAVGEGIAAYTTVLGTLRAFDPGDGSSLRSFEVDDVVVVPPAVVDGVAFLQTTAGSIHGVDLGTGVERWQHSVGPPGRAPAIAATSDLLFVTEPGSRLHAVDATDGTVHWSWGERGAPVTAPSVVDDRVYFLASSGTFCAVDAGTGSLQWTADVSAPARRPAVAGGRAIVAAGDRLVAIE